MRFLVLACGLLLAAGANADAATYYVSPRGSDTSTGTQASPFKTMPKADAVAQPGDTIRVMPGSYPGLTTTKNGTSAAHITWISDTKWAAEINTTGPSGDTLWWSRGAYVDISGFEVDGSGSAAWIGIEASGTESSITHSHVHHITPKACPANGAAGLLADGYYGASAISITENLVHDIGSASCNSWLYHGLYLGAPGSIAQNNVVYNVNSGFAAHVWHDGRNVKIINNTFVNSRGGVLVGGGDFYHLGPPSGGNIVGNNIVMGCSTGFNQSGDNSIANVFTNNLEYNLTNRVRGTMRASFLQISVHGNPMFLGPTDFHLQSGSPAIGKASPFYAPPTDYDGVTRTSHDIGAYEFSAQRPSVSPNSCSVQKSEPADNSTEHPAKCP
jgi:hypothetical protein